MVTDRLGHAYVISGGSDDARMQAALRLAQQAQCAPEGSRGVGEPCGACRDCRKVEAGIHPDVHVITPSGASVKMHQAHELQNRAWLRPHEGRRNVFILPRADLATNEVANSLLRILEDPPGAVLFLLLAPQAEALLPTVRSRCQTVVLPEQPDLSQESYNAALQLLADVAQMDEWDCLRRAENAEKANSADLIKGLQWVLRDLLLLGTTASGAALLSPEGSAALEQIRAIQPQWVPRRVMQAMDDVWAAHRAIAKNGNLRLVVEVLLLRLRPL